MVWNSVITSPRFFNQAKTTAWMINLTDDDWPPEGGAEVSRAGAQLGWTVPDSIRRVFAGITALLKICSFSYAACQRANFYKYDTAVC